MRLNSLIISAYNSLIANKRRSFFTMLGIIIGISSVITIISLGDGSKNSMMKNLNASNGEQYTEVKFSPYNDESILGFSKNDIEIIRQYPSVKNADSKIKDGTITSDASINSEKFDALITSDKKNSKLIAGNDINENDELIDRNVVLVSNKIAKKYFININNAIGASVILNDISYTINGVFKSDGNSNDFLITDNNLKSKNFTTNIVKIKFLKGMNVSRETKEIVKNLNRNGSNKSSGKYEFIDMQDMLKGIGTVINGITYFIAAVAGISLFIAGIGVMNMMYISVSERTNEIGIRIAMGASKTIILWQFLIEASMLTLVGGLIGYILGIANAFLLSTFLPFKASFTIYAFIITFFTSTTVGIIFGLLPARLASNKNLIDILR